MIKKQTYKDWLTIAVFFLIISIALNIDNPTEKEYTTNYVIEDNITYKQYLDNYYNVVYEKGLGKTVITINNPCIELSRAIGRSMKPYWDNEELVLLDTCFPNDRLEVGDVISYYREWDDDGLRVHHRIIDLDRKKKWVKTQGDNSETNPNPDDLVSFDRIYGKDIGVLNVLEDKRIVREEFVNISEDGFYIASGMIRLG